MSRASRPEPGRRARAACPRRRSARNRAGCAGEHGSRRHRGADQRAGLHGHQPEVGRLGGAGAALEREVEALALDHLDHRALRR